MSVPGVGAIVAITFKSGGDDPSRFRRSRDVASHFGLTPKKYQSGELDVTARRAAFWVKLANYRFLALVGGPPYEQGQRWP